VKQVLIFLAGAVAGAGTVIFLIRRANTSGAGAGVPAGPGQTAPPEQVAPPHITTNPGTFHR
jgi:hypothetical protein